MEDDAWLDYLHSEGVVDEAEDAGKRQNVLNLLKLSLPALTRKVENELYLRSEITCQLVPCGSFGLGAHLSDDTIDLTLLAPGHISRRDFFRIFPEILKEQATVLDVEKVSTYRIRCTVDSISVNIVFVRLKQLDIIPRDIDVLDEKVIKDMDDTCVKSLAGLRTTSFVLKTVHTEDHLEVFRVALRCIKYWARRRGLYQSQSGYLSGHGWTLLLLKTYLALAGHSAQVTLTLTVQRLLSEFYIMWSKWAWPAPVVLSNTIPQRGGLSVDYSALTEMRDAVMPIVTPCYPITNAAPNVTKSTLRVMTRELERAYRRINGLRSPPICIFRPFDMVKVYKHFLAVIVSCDTLHSHQIWREKVSASIPLLVQMFERAPGIDVVQPLAPSLSRVEEYKSQEEKTSLQGSLSGMPRDPQPPSPIPDYGILHRAIYLCGLGVAPFPRNGNEERVVDISEQISIFIRTMEAQRTKEKDVRLEVIAVTRREIAGMKIPFERVFRSGVSF